MRMHRFFFFPMHFCSYDMHIFVPLLSAHKQHNINVPPNCLSLLSKQQLLHQPTQSCLTEADVCSFALNSQSQCHPKEFLNENFAIILEQSKS